MPFLREWRVKLTVQVQLRPTPQQADALLRTLEAANTAANQLSEMAWESGTFRQFRLHRLAYHTLKAQGVLTAQVIVRLIAKVADAYKLDRKRKRTFRLHGGIAYDERILRWCTDSVSIWTVGGRLNIPFVCGKRQQAMLGKHLGESDLVYRDGRFYLLAACTVNEPLQHGVSDFLGVDLGIVNLATDSDGEVYTGRAVERRRRVYAHRRRNLQRKGTRSARRKLRRIGGRQARYQADTNHCISKRIVAKAEGTARGIALEDLTGIRGRQRLRKRQRARFANWGFSQLRQFLCYKARRAGVPLALVAPAFTSQSCNSCGHTERANRKTQSQFLCLVCGHAAPADHNAALNLRARAVVMRPMASGAIPGASCLL